MDDSVKKIKTFGPFTSAKNIVSIPIESISTSITILVKSVYDSIPVEFVLVKSNESVESIENSFPYNMISDSAYLLALNVFISEIGKETLNNQELKQGHLEPIKEETQPINLRTNDEPKMIQVSNTLTTFKKDALVALLIEFKEVFAWSYEDMPGIDTYIVQHCIPTNPTMKLVKQKLRRMKPKWTLKIKEEVEKLYNAGFLRVVNKYSIALHSNKSNHEASQAKIEKNEARVDSQNQRRSRKTVQYRIPEGGQLPRMVS